MKKHYDKVFFLVAIAVFCAAAAFYFTRNPEIAKSKTSVKNTLAQEPQGEAWQDKAVKYSISEPIPWMAPEAQDEASQWRFEVFTPPKIWVDKAGNFITEAPPQDIEVEKVFAIKFGGVTSAVYPIKLAGTIGSIDSPHFQFENELDGSSFVGRIGVDLMVKDSKDLTGRREIPTGLKVLSFTRERVKNADNTLTDVVIVQLEDKNLGKTVELRTDKRTILPGERRIELFSSDDSQKWEIKEVGAQFDFANATYKVKELSFDDAFIVLEQIPADSPQSRIVVRLDASGVAIVEEK